MYERRAIRIVTRESAPQEYLIQFKSQRHKEKALNLILKSAGKYLDTDL